MEKKRAVLFSSANADAADRVISGVVENSLGDISEGVVFGQRVDAGFVHQSRFAAGRTVDAATYRPVDRMRQEVVAVGRGGGGGGGSAGGGG